MSPVVLESVLTCPHCGFAAQDTMPTDACMFFYECRQCKTLLRPTPGDCPLRGHGMLLPVVLHDHSNTLPILIVKSH